jgi:uncharacterized protein (TIGR00369 family)
MVDRTGPFWDGVAGRIPSPRAAQTLGLEFVSFDEATTEIELSFEPGESFTNPSGNVLGAFVAAMLYDTVGPALLATLAPDEFQSTLDLQVSFLRATRPGRHTGRGRVVRRVGDIAHLAAELHDGAGELVARATATAQVIPLAAARDAP